MIKRKIHNDIIKFNQKKGKKIPIKPINRGNHGYFIKLQTRLLISQSLII